MVTKLNCIYFFKLCKFIKFFELFCEFVMGITITFIKLYWHIIIIKLCWFLIKFQFCGECFLVATTTIIRVRIIFMGEFVIEFKLFGDFFICC